MKMSNRLSFTTLLVGLVLITAGSAFIYIQVLPEKAWSADEEHDGHDHAAHNHGNEHKALSNHEEHDESHEEESDSHLHEGEDSDHSDHAHEEGIRINNQTLNQLGIRLATASPGHLEIQKKFPGEIRINTDQLVHIVPRSPGIVREVHHSVGDTVEVGDILGWIESAELGEAKIEYLTQLAELSCCSLDLSRTEEVHDNTQAFLKLLQTNPSLEQIRKSNHAAMGEYRTILVSAYAEFVHAKVSYGREKELFEKKIGKGDDFLQAESRFKKADAEYAATIDSVKFKIQRDLLEARQARQVGEIKLLGAERHLHVLGLTEKEIKSLELSSITQAKNNDTGSACTDPNCKDCQEAKQDQTSLLLSGHNRTERSLQAQRLGWYPLRAPLGGTIIEKHLSLGEKVSGEVDAFTIADLSSVWVNLRIYKRDLSQIQKGQLVHITIPDTGKRTTGIVQFISPLVDEDTRTALARVILPNTQQEWRPGLFVEASTLSETHHDRIVVPKTALQNLQGEAILFVQEEESFVPVAVQAGRSNETHVEIVQGLSTGQRYVAEGAFELKAQIVTSGLGAHAGHGH